MDTGKLIYLFRMTIDPNQRNEAEKQLAEIHKIISFTPSLLQLLMLNEVDMPVRQAVVIYLKHEIESHWVEKEVGPGQPMPFTIHEQDRAMIREAIVDAIVCAPDLIRTQLAQCISIIIKHDFPSKWTQIVDKISIYLQNPNVAGWSGALLCLYQLVKNFEYKKSEERAPLNEAMNLLFPMMYQLCVQLLSDQSEQSVLLQKQILKTYFAFTQQTLPLDLITKELFSQWMEICREVIDRPVPDQTNQVDEEYRAALPWWKCKKWALHIINRMFERYGSPGNVTNEYGEFSKWFLKTFSAGILEVLLKVLDQYRRKIYVSPRVLQKTLNYLNQGVSYAYSWKFLKPHMYTIIQDVLFPMMSYTDADEELWESNPYEYVRVKFDIFEDFVSPVTAAQTLLHSACKKRKDMLQKAMIFVMQVLTSPNADPKQKDGALHMVGTLADVLKRKKLYKDQMENMLCQHVFPEYSSPRGHMRARACWVLHYFSEIKFTEDAVLAEAVRLTSNALLEDRDVPVKVEAAIALQMLLNNQSRVRKYLEPQIKAIALELLNIIRETENDDLTNVMQKIVYTYSEQIMPIAVDICQHLATTFSKVLESDESSDEKAIAAMGLLNTIETLLSVMEENSGIMARLQPIVLQVIGDIFQRSVTEFYEEALSLVYDLTSKTISPDMWQILELMYKVFQKDGFDYFTDMMPSLHNYVTVDTEAFLSNENHVLAMFNMCKAVLTGDTNEEPECHAAKLLEVIILQCKGRIDHCIPPFVELVLQRLMRELKTSELRTMCLQVVIAALYYNYQLLFETLEKIQCDNSGESMTTRFIKQWIIDTDCFLGLHDRKLCVLGLCQLISMSPNRPPILNELAGRIIPSLILLFEGLKRAYVAKAQESDEEESEDESEGDQDVLSSDEDDIDETGAEYLESLQSSIRAKDFPNLTASLKYDDDDTDDEDYEPNEETELETYTTPLDNETCEIDEYVVFKEVFQNLQVNDPSWFQVLTENLTAAEQKSLQEVIVLADQRKAAAESKRIEQSGGNMRYSGGKCINHRRRYLVIEPGKFS
ncbi:UNVERIFIED_CONTAM: hypothetical protein PYX00_001656 [Menopon gallinae]|uniref:Importin N-terminal domain-containing protein n=1 Tax=Menopon gallinae TaxID=328185 RepID=A0AAW2IFT4_9NEOP